MGMTLKQRLVAAIPWEQIYKDELDWDGKLGSNIKCVSHADSTPSMTVYEKGAVFCHACGFKASTFVGCLEVHFGIKFKKLCKQLYASYIEPLVDEKDVAKMHRALMGDKEILNQVKERMALTREQLVAFEIGWHAKKKRLSIPIRNEFGMCVDVRLYDLLKMHPPKMKVVSWAKGFGKARLWPLPIKRRVVIVEGEKDTLAARMIGLPAHTVTSGAMSFSEEAVARLKGVEVFIVGDNDKSGMAGRRKRAQLLQGVAESVTVLTLPVKGEKEDMWDWVHKYGGTQEDFWKLSGSEDTEVVTKAALSGKTGRMSEVFGEDSPQNPVDKAAIIFETLALQGWFYRLDNGQVMYATEDQCVLVDKRDVRFRGLLMRMDARINREVPVGRVIIEHIETMAHSTATATRASGQMYYDSRNARLYFRPQRSSQMIVELCEDGSRNMVRNGTNDSNVLLTMDDPSLADWELDWKADDGIKELWDKLFAWIPADDCSRLMTMAWLLAGLFRQVTSDRPILRVMAPSASGKSHVLRALAAFMYDSPNMYDEASSTVASMYSNAAKRPLLMVDNIELQHLAREGMSDLFIGLATCAVREKRKLGTDTEVVREPVDCIAATTGIESFNKPELVNRFLYVHIDRAKHGKPGYHDFVVFENIRKARGRMMAAVLATAARLIPKVKACSDSAIELAARFQTLRFPAYMALMKVWLEHLVEVIEPKDAETGTVLTADQVVERVCAGQETETADQHEGTNQVLAWLDTLWARTCGNPPTFLDSGYKPIRDKESATWYFTPTEMLNELSLLAKHIGRRLPFDNAHQLSLRLNDARKILEAAGWEIDRFKSAGRQQIKLTRCGQVNSNAQASREYEEAKRLERACKRLKGRRKSVPQKLAS